jgi:phenylpropionate dioxygenase-like ring-hydroxylating dioxygenase large terminal subunit
MYNTFRDRLRSILAEYPGGYKKYARGSLGTPPPKGKHVAQPFRVPTDPKDMRSRMPPLGHREYWYPALPAKDIRKKVGQPLRMLGEDLVFFRGKNGQISALKDACPHRGAYLSLGDCFYEGTITCPYHGGTYDGEGNTVAMLTEGPDSKLVGHMKAWAFPTITLKGTVFVWMGAGEPVDPREDLPPELFDEPHTLLRWSCQVMHCNWILVLENTNDAHNAFYVHRNCISVLRSRLGGRPRTPLGYRTKIINDRRTGRPVNANYTVGAGVANTERYYYDEDGNIPYQMYYPGVDGVWPLHRWRLMWTWIWSRKARNTKASGQRWGDGRNQGVNNQSRQDDDWQGTRLPGISAKGTGGKSKYRSHRWAVPIENDMTRVVYLNIERYMTKPNILLRIYKGFTWPYRNWNHNFNFRYADLDAERTCRYDLPEYLSATDSTVVVIRKVLTEYARGIEMSENAEHSRDEEIVTQRNLAALTADESASSVHIDNIKEGLEKTGYPSSR